MRAASHFSNQINKNNNIDFKNYSAIPSLNMISIPWEDLSDIVRAVNPDLADLFDAVSHNKPPIYVARYHYGDTIIKQGMLQIPTRHLGCVNLHHGMLPRKLQDDLGYCKIPFGLMLNANSEVVSDIEDEVLSLHVFKPGAWFGYWEWLDREHFALTDRPWDVIAGSRQLFTLPKLSNKIHLSKLARAFKLSPISGAKKNNQCFNIFKTIFQKQIQSEPDLWTADVLLFPKEWIEPVDCIEFYRLEQYLLKKEWDDARFWRNRFSFELLEGDIAAAQYGANLKPSPIQIEATLDILLIGLGATVAYRPLEVGKNDSTFGPLKWLQNSLLRFYGLEYYPTLMASDYIQAEGPCVYYSLQQPTVLSSVIKSSRPKSTLNDLRVISRLLDKALNLLKEREASLYKILQHVEFTCFHAESDPLFNIKPSVQIPDEDPVMLPESSQKPFCATANFFKGCVRIRRLA